MMSSPTKSWGRRGKPPDLPMTTNRITTASPKPRATAPTTAAVRALPAGWGVAAGPDGSQFFIDHINGTSSWVDPRVSILNGPSSPESQLLEKDLARLLVGKLPPSGPVSGASRCASSPTRRNGHPRKCQAAAQKEVGATDAGPSSPPPLTPQQTRARHNHRVRWRRLVTVLGNGGDQREYYDWTMDANHQEPRLRSHSSPDFSHDHGARTPWHPRVDSPPRIRRDQSRPVSLDTRWTHGRFPVQQHDGHNDTPAGEAVGLPLSPREVFLECVQSLKEFEVPSSPAHVPTSRTWKSSSCSGTIASVGESSAAFKSIVRQFEEAAHDEAIIDAAPPRRVLRQIGAAAQATAGGSGALSATASAAAFRDEAIVNGAPPRRVLRRIGEAATPSGSGAPSATASAAASHDEAIADGAQPCRALRRLGKAATAAQTAASGSGAPAATASAAASHDEATADGAPPRRALLLQIEKAASGSAPPPATTSAEASQDDSNADIAPPCRVLRRIEEAAGGTAAPSTTASAEVSNDEAIADGAPPRRALRLTEEAAQVKAGGSGDTSAQQIARAQLQQAGLEGAATTNAQQPQQPPTPVETYAVLPSKSKRNIKTARHPETHAALGPLALATADAEASHDEAIADIAPPRRVLRQIGEVAQATAGGSAAPPAIASASASHDEAIADGAPPRRVLRRLGEAGRATAGDGHLGVELAVAEAAVGLEIAVHSRDAAATASAKTLHDEPYLDVLDVTLTPRQSRRRPSITSEMSLESNFGFSYVAGATAFGPPPAMSGFDADVAFDHLHGSDLEHGVGSGTGRRRSLSGSSGASAEEDRAPHRRRHSDDLSVPFRRRSRQERLQHDAAAQAPRRQKLSRGLAVLIDPEIPTRGDHAGESGLRGRDAVVLSAPAGADSDFRVSGVDCSPMSTPVMPLRQHSPIGGDIDAGILGDTDILGDADGAAGGESVGGTDFFIDGDTDTDSVGGELVDAMGGEFDGESDCEIDRDRPARTSPCSRRRATPMYHLPLSIEGESDCAINLDDPEHARKRRATPLYELPPSVEGGSDGVIDLDDPEHAQRRRATPMYDLPPSYSPIDDNDALFYEWQAQKDTYQRALMYELHAQKDLLQRDQARATEDLDKLEQEIELRTIELDATQARLQHLKHRKQTHP